jgi:SAM-dependent methyltransferase
MYKALKQIIKLLLPNHFSAKHKTKFRKLVAVFYKGSNYTCNICEFNMRQFIRVENNLYLCPNCGSLSRTRQLWNILEQELNNKTVLHFSPTQALKSKIEKTTSANYTSSDYAGEFNADKALNIESIDEPDANYDIVICYHILEHVVNDTKAISELYRILKSNGVCYIQTPFKAGEIYENYSITEETDRLKHFGQRDHVRIYSIEGLKSRLEVAGFQIEIKTAKNKVNNKFGFLEEETIVIASKVS